MGCGGQLFLMLVMPGFGWGFSLLWLEMALGAFGGLDDIGCSNVGRGGFNGMDS